MIPCYAHRICYRERFSVGFNHLPCRHNSFWSAVVKTTDGYLNVELASPISPPQTHIPRGKVKTTRTEVHAVTTMEARLKVEHMLRNQCNACRLRV